MYPVPPAVFGRLDIKLAPVIDGFAQTDLADNSNKAVVAVPFCPKKSRGNRATTTCVNDKVKTQVIRAFDAVQGSTIPAGPGSQFGESRVKPEACALLLCPRGEGFVENLTPHIEPPSR